MAEAVKERKESGLDSPEMRKAMTEAATPGSQHKELAKMAGTWTMRIRSWADPGKPPVETMGTSDQKMLLDGRFLHQSIKAEMMGQPYQGYGFTGYYNHTAKYMSVWIDSTSTSMLYMEGTGSDGGRTVIMEGETENPVLGRMRFRSVTRIQDDNRNTFELYGAPRGGKEMKMMEIVYTRLTSSGR